MEENNYLDEGDFEVKKILNEETEEVDIENGSDKDVVESLKLNEKKGNSDSSDNEMNEKEEFKEDPNKFIVISQLLNEKQNKAPEIDQKYKKKGKSVNNSFEKPENPSNISTFAGNLEKNVNVLSIDTERLLENLKYHKKYIEFLISSVSDFDEILEKFLKKCKILYETKDLEDFIEETKLSDQEFILNNSEERPLKLDFDHFCKSCENWHYATKFPNPLRTELRSTLWNFKNLQKLAKNNQESQFLQEIIQKIFFQLQKMLTPPKPVQVSKKPPEFLSEVYNFYIKQQKTAAKTQTFETLDLQFKTLTLPKFLFFCKDFKILKPGKNPKKVSEQIQFLQDLFQKHSEFGKTMSESQFFESMTELSSFLFTKKFDSDHLTDYSSLSAEEKLPKFFEFLGFNEKKDYKSKMIGCQAINIKDSRIPDSEKLKKTNKKNLEKVKKTKQVIQEWKLSKKKSLSVLSNKEKVEEPAHNKNIVTMDYLRKSKIAMADLSELIQEDSSDEEIFGMLKKKKNNLSQSISSKILNRAQELSLLQQRSDNKKIEAVLNGSKYITRVFKYSKK